MKIVLKIFIALIVAYFAYNQFVIERNQNVIITNQNTIITELTELQTADSLIINHFMSNDTLYWNHLSQCSFISRDQLKFDKNGYAQLRNKFDFWEYN